MHLNTSARAVAENVHRWAAIPSANCGANATLACRANPFVFYAKRVREATTHAKLAAFYLYLHRIRRRVERDPSPYTDAVLAPPDDEVLPLRRKE